MFLRYTFTTGRAHYDQLILSFIVALIVCGSFVFVPCFAIQYLLSILVLHSFAREERADCFILIVFLLSCDCKCSVYLPHGVVGWSAVCDCGIFWTLSFKNFAQHRRLPDFIPHIS